VRICFYFLNKVEKNCNFNRHNKILQILLSKEYLIGQRIESTLLTIKLSSYYLHITRKPTCNSLVRVFV